MNISCAACHVELRPQKNDVHVIEYADIGPYKIWAADLWVCPHCGASIISGFSAHWHEHYEPDFKKRLETALADPWHVCIYTDQEQREWFEPGDDQ